MAFKGKKGDAYNVANKRAFYIGYGMGISGRSITEDFVQDYALRQKTADLQVSFISGICTGETHRKGSWKNRKKK